VKLFLVMISLALQSILKNKTRALLTMLGIVIGVAAVIVMVAVGYGARSRIRQQIDALGTNMIVITPGASASAGVSQGAQAFATLTLADADKLRNESQTLAAVSPVIIGRSQVIAPAGNWRTSINGVDTDYQTIRDCQTDTGAFFGRDDVRAARSVAVLGRTVAQRIFADGDPVGQQIQIAALRFKVTGVLVPKGQTASGSDSDNTELQRTLRDETAHWGIEIVRTELKEIDPPKDVLETMNKVVKAENEKVAAIDFATATETMADGARRAEIKKADGVKQGRILQAEGEAQAIKLIYEASNQYFVGNAQLLRRLETAEKCLLSNAKVVIPTGSQLVNVIGELAGVLPSGKQEPNSAPTLTARS
jgi:ABC-type antimicrobial peptide transport system permease subunit